MENLNEETVQALNELTLIVAEIDKKECRVRALGLINKLRGTRIEDSENFNKCKKPHEYPTGPDLVLSKKDLLLREIRACNLTYRTENCLRLANIFYVGDLVEKTETQMLKIKNFGLTCLTELKEFLAEDNLSLKAV